MKSKMNKFRIIQFTIFIIGVLAIGFLGYKNAISKIITNITPDISADELRAVVVEDFEKPMDWSIDSVPKKNKNPKKDPIPILKIKYVQGGPSDLGVEKWSADKKGMSKKMCLGLHFRFKYPGYNSVHILPPLEVRWDDPTKKVFTYDGRTGKEIQERALQLPGKVKGISVWFHGRGNNYDLECWVKDYKGDVHILKLGSLNFVGWRPLKITIPPYIPQEVESFPQTKVIKIVRFVIRSNPYEDPKDTYMFFDQLKVLTDVFEVSFDGHNLHKVFEGESFSPVAPTPVQK